MSAWLHLCGHRRCCAAVAEGPGEGTGSGGRGRARPRHFTIDVHCHVLTLAVEQLVATHPRRLAEPAAMLASMGEESVVHNQSVMLPKAFAGLTSIEQRLRDMDAMGVDMQVISPSPNQYYYWAEPELASEIVRLQNQHIAEVCAKHPARLAGLGTVALQHPELAARQLLDAVNVLGLKGVEISTSVEGRELDDAALAPFWAAAQSTGAVVFIHPFGTTLGERTRSHYLSNTIGQPLETTLALSRLIFSGTLDRYPGLRLLAAHGGGYLPMYSGRSDHAFKVRPEAAKTVRRPSEYLREIHFDSLVYEPGALRQLIDNVGASQVLLGTDYPYDMGHDEPQELLRLLPGAQEAEQAAVLGQNARRLFNL